MKDMGRMAVSVLLAAAAFLFLFIGLGWNLIFCAALGVGVYFGVFLLTKPRRKLAGIDVEAIKGGEELTRLLDDAKEDLEQIESSVKRLRDPAVKADGEKLLGTGVRILRYLGKNPDKIRQARRFFTYYLDTAAKLLARYVEFQETQVSSREVSGILERTARALPVLNEAFENQFTHLMEGELLDVEADIELLESTLKMEGGK